MANGPRPEEELGDLIETDPHTALDTAFSNLIEAAGGRAGLLGLWDERQHRVAHTSTVGLPPDVLDQARPLVDEQLARLDESGSQAVVAADQAVAILPTEVGELEVGKLRALALPIRSQGRLIGLLCLFPPTDTPDVFADHPELYNIIVDHVDVLLQNTRLVQRLVEEKRWLEAVVQQSADAILILGRDRQIVGFNPALARLTGWTVDGARGRPCRDVFGLTTAAGEDFDRTIVALHDAGAERDHLAAVEAVCRRRDGSTVPVEVSYAVIRSAEGEPLGGIIGLRDITARKQAEQLQSTFLSIVSHELQTPIAIIKGYAGLLAEQDVELDAGQFRQKLAIIREESERLSTLVDKLLYASRLQAGGVELRREPLAVAPLCRRVVQKMGAVSARHRLVVAVPANLPPASADYDALQEVLVNLIDNAIKYSPNGGQIAVAAERAGDQIAISVADEGIGVPAEERERIFERFSRTREAGRRAKGTGLGLYICKAIVDAHGGRIWAEPAGERGTRFCFTLPIGQPDRLLALGEER